jgi:putative transposase
LAPAGTSAALSAGALPTATAAHRFCRAFDEIRTFLRPTSYINQKASLACHRTIHVQRVAALRDLISAA